MWNVGTKYYLPSGEVKVTLIDEFINEIPAEKVDCNRVIIPYAKPFIASFQLALDPPIYNHIESIEVNLNPTTYIYDYTGYLHEQFKEIFSDVKQEKVYPGTDTHNINILHDRNMSLLREGCFPTHIVKLYNHWTMLNPVDFKIFSNNKDAKLICLRPHVLNKFSFEELIEELEEGWSMKVRQELDELRQEKI